MPQDALIKKFLGEAVCGMPRMLCDLMVVFEPGGAPDALRWFGRAFWKTGALTVEGRSTMEEVWTSTEVRTSRSRLQTLTLCVRPGSVPGPKQMTRTASVCAQPGFAKPMNGGR